MNQHENVPIREDAIGRLIQEAGPRPPVPEDDLAEITEAARAEWHEMVSREQESRGFPSQGMLALAASLLVALAAGWWWVGSRGPIAVPDHVATVELLAGEIRAEGVGRADSPFELTVGSELPSGAELETLGDATRIALRLVHGHSLRLDRDTRVRFVSARRLELERGAVYLDSGPAQQTEAVEVMTPYGVVRDIGTQFEVRLGVEDEGVRVRVREGQVSLESGASSYLANAGEELSLRRDGSVTRGKVETYGPDWDWVLASAPSLDIEGVSLVAFLEWVARETGWRIEYADEDLAVSAGTIRVHGSIDGLTPEESIEVVLVGSGLGHRIEDGALHITSR